LLPAISLIPGLFCLGLSALVVAPSLLLARRNTLEQRWRLIALVFASGLLLNYLLIVIVGGLRVGMVAALVIGLSSVVMISLRLGREAAHQLRLGIGPSFCFMLIITLLAVPTLLKPLTEWDARSIWFFHAKMIYYAGGLVKDAGWEWSCCTFSHVDYPKLVPVLAAQAASLAGFWNEQLPKFALLLLLLPPLAVTISFWRAGLATIALLLIIWAKLAPALCSGYMDAPLAVYGLFGVLMIGTWLATGAQLELAIGVLFIGVTMGLKNEGSLLAVILFSCMIPAALLAWFNGKLAVNRSKAIEIGCICLFAIISGGSWLLLREIWGLLHNDMQLGLSSLPVISGRIQDPGALKMIVQSTLIANDLLYTMLIGVGATALIWVLQTGAELEAVFCVIVGSIYLASIELVYLATPYDLKWHLATSAERTTLLPAILLLAPVILLLRGTFKKATTSVNCR
jgi:hypothetical protein